ncbi:MAG: SAM-dependent methyltransferase [Rhodospirillaceae bacterium]|nr:SAM-dependent methyltransferase [Rhodospirillaceae bacterium]
MTSKSAEDATNFRRDAPAARRNAGAILPILADILPASGTVLEIGSGTGQHAVIFAQALAPIKWLPTDTSQAQLASISAWISGSKPPLPLSPRKIDATSKVWPIDTVDDVGAIFSANVIHISPWAVCAGILAGAGRILPEDGPLVFYGPFKRDGQHTAPTNAAFDASLRLQNSEWGVRDVADIAVGGETEGLILTQVIEMPANNLIVTLRRAAT